MSQLQDEEPAQEMRSNTTHSRRFAVRQNLLGNFDDAPVGIRMPPQVRPVTIKHDLEQEAEKADLPSFTRR
jgi:hypothetical protein